MSVLPFPWRTLRTSKVMLADSILRVFCILADFLSTCSVSDWEKLLESQSIIVDLSANSFRSTIIRFLYFAALLSGPSMFRIVYHFDESPTSSFQNNSIPVVFFSLKSTLFSISSTILAFRWFQHGIYTSFHTSPPPVRLFIFKKVFFFLRTAQNWLSHVHSIWHLCLQCTFNVPIRLALNLPCCCYFYSSWVMVSQYAFNVYFPDDKWHWAYTFVKCLLSPLPIFLLDCLLFLIDL